MQKMLVTEDGTRYKLSPLTYDEWMSIDMWTGGSDTEFAAWLREHDFHEIGDFSEDTLAKCKIELAEEVTPLLFSTDGETWQPYAELRMTNPPRAYDFNDRT